MAGRLLVAAVVLAGCRNELAEADELLATGDPEGAAAIYRARLEKEPGDGAGTIGLAQALYTAALEKSKSGADTVEGWNDVVEAMDAAVVVDPAPEGVAPVTDAQYADALFRAGMKRYEAKDGKGAAEALEKAADKGKKTAELYAALARARAAGGDTDKAIEAAYRAVKLNERDVALMREAAGWAKAADLFWVHHHFFYLAEKEKPTGFEFLAPTDITKGLTMKYGALNMVNDTLGLFLFNEEVDSRSWDGIKEREAVIADMDKFITKPPKAFAAADKPRLPWVVYHYYNTTGVVFAYLGADEKAKEWLGKARDVAATGKVKHPDLSKDEIEDQLGWAEANLELLK
jgi:tetratricopeptide (TPR) repeat protein